MTGIQLDAISAISERMSSQDFTYLNFAIR